jgi:hypothetical protein
MLPNGDRLVYFQDISGSIREAQYSISESQWDVNPSFVVVLDAHNVTSIAASSANITHTSIHVINSSHFNPGLFYEVSNVEMRFKMPDLNLIFYM